MSSYELGNIVAVYYYFDQEPVEIVRPPTRVQLPSTKKKISDAIEANPAAGPKSLLDIVTPDLLTAKSTEIPRNIRQVNSFQISTFIIKK